MYLIDEEELMKFIDKLKYSNGLQATFSQLDMVKAVNKWLKDKKQVTEIASGEVDTISCWECDYGFQVGGETTHDLFQKYIGKSIKIYIEVEE